MGDDTVEWAPSVAEFILADTELSEVKSDFRALSSKCLGARGWLRDEIYSKIQ